MNAVDLQLLHVHLRNLPTQMRNVILNAMDDTIRRRVLGVEEATPEKVSHGYMLAHGVPGEIINFTFNPWDEFDEELLVDHIQEQTRIEITDEMYDKINFRALDRLALSCTFDTRTCEIRILSANI